MKKVILVLMILLICLSACNETSMRGTSEKPDIDVSDAPRITNSNGMIEETSTPLEETEQLPDIFEPVNLLSIFQPAYSKDEKYFNLMSWQEYIADKFDIEINIFYQSKEVSGVQAVYYYNYPIGYPFSKVNQVFDYTSSDMAYDLSPYYEKYGWNDFIDPLYIEDLKVDGRIYAVPTEANKYIIPRYYNAEYLAQLGMEVPKDINSFYNYLIEAKKIMKGENILLPMLIPQHQMFPCTSDIFRAFGAYVNSEYNSALSFNPNTQSFEDAIFSDDIESALDFFKTLQTDNIIGFFGNAYCESDDFNRNQFFGDRLKISPNFASEYNFIIDENTKWFRKFLRATPRYEAVSGYYLEHTNNKNVCEVRSDMGFYVFPTNIENINGTIDLFNSVMTDKTYYPDLLYGLENTDYEIIGNEIYPKRPRDGTFTGIRMISAVVDKNNYYSANNIDIVGDIASSLMYESNIFTQTSRYRDIVGGSTISSSSYFDNLFLGCVSSEEAVKEYRKWFMESGMYQTLDKLNERINATTAYEYTP